MSALDFLQLGWLKTVTYWYEIYYEVFLGGKYFQRMHEMHRAYGPIVRINPNEVHFNDPDFIDTLFPTKGRKTDKPIMVGQRTGTPNSIVATIHHETHRMRRNSINGFFSNASIRRVEPIIREYLEKMLSRWDENSGKDGKVLQMHPIFKAYASDVITTYAFGDCFHFLGEEDWGMGYFSSTDAYFSLTHVFGHFPIVMKLVNNVPTWALGLFIPNLTEMSSPNPEEVKSTIFEGILSSSLPEEEKTDARMAHDAQLIGLAGEGTTAYTLSATLFELLAHPEDLQRVKTELAAAIPDKNKVPSYSDVENLPYFNAAIQEGLRLHPGVMSRMPRISPEVEIQYHDKRRDRSYALPPGTLTSMSTFITHTDPGVFADPYDFQPQRWIDDPKLSRSFIAFSRGSRNCVGQNFARREMSMVLATILNRYDLYGGQEGRTLELYDTTRERDIVANHEMIIPMPAKGSHGLRVKVTLTFLLIPNAVLSTNMSSPKRTVLITGCSDGGLGAALAIAFHEAGLHVYATARNPSKMEHLASLGIETIQLDVQSEASIAACVSKLPGLDILVNNAGAQYVMPVVDASISEAKKLFDLNVWSHIAVTQALLPLLLKSSRGMIVNQTSVGACTTIPFQAVYNSSKAALAMLSDCLRLELQPFGIVVVDLRTGVVKTNLIKNLNQSHQSSLPNGSIYEPAKEAVEKALRQEGFENQGMPAEKWAKLVVQDLLRQKPPSVIWRGESAWLTRIATVLPFGMLDGMVKKLTGLDVVERAVRQ
ncbi:MAG: hypothetical protein Q9170_001045 [Blastenia crenularia]